MTALRSSSAVLAARTAALSLEGLTGLVRAVADDESLWRPRLLLPAPGEDRWWCRLSADQRVDVWLLSWLPGHSTELHDHGASAAAFSVVRGRLDEVRLDREGNATAYTRQPGSVTWVAPQVVHDVTGSGTGPAVSIHAYSPPLHRMNYYARTKRGNVRLTRSVRTDQPEGADR